MCGGVNDGSKVINMRSGNDIYDRLVSKVQADKDACDRDSSGDAGTAGEGNTGLP